MKMALMIVFVLGVLLYVVFGFRKRLNGDTAPGEVKTKKCEGGETCGVSCFCDDKTLARQMNDEIIYFEDEELDKYKGVASDAYTDSQVDEFSEVLTTLRKQEIIDWLHSLDLRKINLPEQLKDEVSIMMQ